MPYKIVDDRLIIADVPMWLVDYNTSTGLVTSMSNDTADAQTFSVEADANAACYLINNNANNSFIGHVPPPPHH
jgi:hypothetical protein